MAFEFVSKQDGVVVIRLDNGERIRVIDKESEIMLAFSGSIAIFPDVANTVRVTILSKEKKI